MNDWTVRGMNEHEEKAFKKAYEFYQYWRETVIETDEQWSQLADDVRMFSMDMDIDHNPLAAHLLTAVLDTLNDLYKNGMKPMPAGYFGRDDL